MSDTAEFQLSLDLKPIYDVDLGGITLIGVKLDLEGPLGGLQGGSPLDEKEAGYYFQHTVTDNLDNNATNTISGYDKLGLLRISVKHDSHQSHSPAWKTYQPVQGNKISVQYSAKPVGDEALILDDDSRKRRHNGLVGIAATFIPVPVTNDSIPIDVKIEWDTSQVPQGTRTLSSFGEENFSRKGLPFKALSKCVFMVGRINSFVPPASHDEVGEVQAGGKFQGIHWLGTLPDNFSAMKEFTSNMFPRLSAFFKDDKTSNQIFMRKVSRGLRATSVTGGTLIDYDDDAKQDHDWDLVRLFNASMLTTWAHLDVEDDGTSNDWFTQGICHLYTIYLPYRFGQRSPDYFRATLNGYLSSYFTNPLASYPLDEIPLDSWYGQSALAMRSCIYMIRMDCYTRRASKASNAGVLRPIDEIVADIRGRRLRGEKVQLKDWLKYLGDWIGEESAQEYFHRMRSGEVMDLEDMRTSFDGIQSEDQRVLDLGLDESSLTTGIVSGVKEQSEAAKEGLRNGDKIVWHSRLEKCRMEYEEKFHLLVDRDGKRVNIEYWPRSDEVVKSWVSRKKQV